MALGLLKKAMLLALCKHCLNVLHCLNVVRRDGLLIPALLHDSPVTYKSFPCMPPLGHALMCCDGEPAGALPKPAVN